MYDVVFKTDYEFRLDVIKAFLISNKREYEDIDSKQVKVFMCDVKDVFTFSDEVLEFFLSHKHKHDSGIFGIEIGISDGVFYLELTDHDS